MLVVLLGTHSDLITVCTRPVNLILQSAQLVIPGFFIFFSGIVQFFLLYLAYYISGMKYISQLVACLDYIRNVTNSAEISLLARCPHSFKRFWANELIPYMLTVIADYHKAYLPLLVFN